jgi:phosphate-selective porin OprO/OprP
MQQKKNNQNQQTKQVSWSWVAGITGLACIAANSSLAAVDAHHQPVYDAASTSKLLQTKGGIKASIPGDSRFWFSSGGVLRLDGSVFMGSSDAKQTYYPNSAYIRTAEWNVRGGVGEHLSYELRLKLDGGNGRFTDAMLSYSGFAPNILVSAGRLNSSFSLDNDNSTSWQPFIGTAATSIFYPNPGLGLKYEMWWDHCAFKLAALQPDQGTIITPNNRGSDPWQYSARAFYAPINEYGNVYHFGTGAILRQIENQNYGGGDIKRFTMNAYPGARGRNTATLVQLVEPGIRSGGDTNDIGMRASWVREFNLEIARQWGPVLLFGEYFYMNVKRPQPSVMPSSFPFKQTVRFKNWFFLGSWILTGESREYTMADGTFSTIKPTHSYGAWEVAARYTYVDLNDRDIQGGSQHDLGLALNWFYNANLRFSLDYVRAHIHPAVIYPAPNLRKLDILAGRVQIRW